MEFTSTIQTIMILPKIALAILGLVLTVTWTLRVFAR